MFHQTGDWSDRVTYEAKPSRSFICYSCYYFLILFASNRWSWRNSAINRYQQLICKLSSWGPCGSSPWQDLWGKLVNASWLSKESKEWLLRSGPQQCQEQLFGEVDLSCGSHCATRFNQFYQNPHASCRTSQCFSFPLELNFPILSYSSKFVICTKGLAATKRWITQWEEDSRNPSIHGIQKLTKTKCLK